MWQGDLFKEGGEAVPVERVDANATDVAVYDVLREAKSPLTPALISDQTRIPRKYVVESLRRLPKKMPPTHRLLRGFAGLHTSEVYEYWIVPNQTTTKKES